MTALAAWCGGSDGSGDAQVEQILAGLSLRGDRPTLAHPAPGSCVGAALFEWQSEWAGTGVGRCGSTTVVADATLYYVSDLLAALREAGVVPASHWPADLIAAAVAAWGGGAVERLEGDFAFVAFDADRTAVLAARDWGGLRSLYFAPTPGGIAFASEAAALASLPAVNGSFNLPWIAEAASGRYESLTETAFQGVELVPAGWLVRAVFGPGASGTQVTRARSFVSPIFLGDEAPGVPFEAAKVELRALMEAAVRERLPAHGDLVVALSGGRDSAAVYALARARVGERVKSASVSYPEGDPGREDDIVLDILRQSGGSPHWIDATQLPILGTIEESAKSRPEPFGHVFAEFQEGLARASRTLGARVMLNGSGGDQFFSGEPTYLADLLRHGRLGTLLQEWRLLEGGRDWRAFFSLAIWPNLGFGGNWLLGALREGRPVRDPFDRPLPDWIRPDFAVSAGLEARHRANFPSRRAASGASDFERRWLLTHPFYPRVFAEAYRLYLKEGIELRTPLADRRLLRFAATRPRWERRTGWQVKVLMRASLNDLLPPSVTGDRPRPTGTTEGLLALALRRHLGGLLDGMARDSLLEGLGVIDAAKLAKISAQILRGEVPASGLEAVYTILTETWLKSQIGNGFPVAKR